MTENTIWLPAAAGLQLGSNEVHVWRASLDVDSAVQERLSVLLSSAEQERAARFAFARDRNRFTVARAILRQLLGGYLREPPQDVVLETLAYGKPIVAATSRIPSLRFNLSHSHQFALFAFCLEREVGIDIEKIRPQVAFEGIESRYFSPNERAELEITSPRSSTRGFLPVLDPQRSLCEGQRRRPESSARKFQRLFDARQTRGTTKFGRTAMELVLPSPSSRLRRGIGR